MVEASTFDASTSAALRKSIKGRSDEEIEALIAAVGVDEALRQAMELQAREFQPARAKGRSATVCYAIHTHEGPRSFQVIIADGQHRWSEGAPEVSRLQVEVSAPNFLRLRAGLLVAATAFFDGRLKATGDLLFARDYLKWIRL